MMVSEDITETISSHLDQTEVVDWAGKDEPKSLPFPGQYGTNGLGLMNKTRNVNLSISNK